MTKVINVTGELTGYSDSFAIADINNIRGGYRAVNHLEELDNIPIDKRKIGMKVYVIDEDKEYMLKDDGWEEYKASGGSNDAGVLYSDINNVSTSSVSYDFNNKAIGVLYLLRHTLDMNVIFNITNPVLGSKIGIKSLSDNAITLSINETTIDDQNNIILAIRGMSVMLYYTGSEWIVI